MRLRNRVTMLAIALAMALPCLGQETIVAKCATRAACQLNVTPVSWAAGNQVWIFSPIAPNVSIQIYVHNNNASNAHTQTLTVYQTNSPNVNSLLSHADQWTQDAVTQNTVALASCNSVARNQPTSPGAAGMGTCYVSGMFAAQIAIRITGAAAAGGSPDTFDIGVVQEQTSYLSGPQPGQDSSTGANLGGATTIVNGLAVSPTPVTVGTIGSGVVQPLASVVNDGGIKAADGTFSQRVISEEYMFDGLNFTPVAPVSNASVGGGNIPGVGIIPTTQSTQAILPIRSSIAESNHGLKASGGNLYSVQITTGATAGLLMIFDANSAPADGAVTPMFCFDVPATSTLSKDWPIPARFASGLFLVFSSGTNCFSKTASATAFFSGMVE